MWFDLKRRKVLVKMRMIMFIDGDNISCININNKWLILAYYILLLINIVIVLDNLLPFC